MEMRKALGKSPWREKSNEEYLRENQKDYEKLAYDLGLAYFYSYQGTGNKASSRKWLQIAAKARPSEKLEDSQIQRAGRLWKIAEYYGTLGIIGSGRGSFSLVPGLLDRSCEDTGSGTGRQQQTSEPSCLSGTGGADRGKRL